MMALEDFPKSYKDPLYASLDAGTEQKLGLPVGMVQAIRTDGERTNADRVSSAGARTPYQFTPATRRAVLDKYGVDAYLSPETASLATGLLLQESLKRNQGDPEKAVREYHGGTNPKNWGPQNEAYWGRVGPALETHKTGALSEKFAQWKKTNPTEPTAPAADPVGQTLAEKFANWKAGTDQIPGTPLPDRAPVSTALPQAATKPAPGIIDKAIGTGEAALSTVTGMTGGLAGMIGGTAKGITQSILDGSFGTPEAQRMVEQAAAGGAEALTYAPRTQSGQDQTAVVGQGMQAILPVAAIAHTMPPMMSGAAKGTPGAVIGRAGAEGVARDMAPGVVGDAAAAGVGAVLDGAGKVAGLAKGVTTLPRRALAALTADKEASPTPGTKGSMGAAGTDMATQRRALAADLPVPIELTKGQASRDPAQLKFEVETAKLPEAGKPLRDRLIQQNDAILSNFDAWSDATGAEAPSLRAVGAVVDQALRDKAARAKTEIRARYKAAENAGEMEAPVSLNSVIDHLNQAAPEASTAPLLTTARALAVKLGIARDEGGILVPQGSGVVDTLMNRATAEPGVSLKRAELFRQAINRATDFEPTNIRQATIIKGLVDEATQGMGGDLYKQARAARSRYAQEFEDHAVIAKMLNNKRGTSDRQVAFEDIFQHSILKGSLDDVRTVRKVLQTAGPEGVQAWKELQGAALRDIRDKATQSVALDSAGNRVISPAALDKAITALDADGKLEFIFGKKGAQQLRDIRELAQVARTVPPESAVNFSNTASTLLSGVGDIAGYGMSGVPVPVFTLGKMAMGYVKDSRLRSRINDALNQQIKKQAPGQRRPPMQAPANHTIH